MKCRLPLCLCLFAVISSPCQASTFEFTSIVVPSGKSILKKSVSQIGKSFQNRKTQDLCGISKGLKTRVLGIKGPIGQGLMHRPLILEAGLDAKTVIDSGLKLEHNSKISISQEVKILSVPVTLKFLVREKGEHFDSATLGFEMSL